MPKFCKTCNRPIEGKRSEHDCKLARLSDGRMVPISQVLDENSEVRKQIDNGEVTVLARYGQEPLMSVSQRMQLPGGTSNR